MTDSGRMIPSSADAPTLALAACVLMASEFPKAYTPDEQFVLGTRAVDAVFAVWDEIATRIATPLLVTPEQQPVVEQP